MVTYATLSDYRACVRKYHGQIGAYAASSHMDECELVINFYDGVGTKVWVDMMCEDLCMVSGYSATSWVFFGGGGGPGAWILESKVKIEKWFAARAPGVSPWERARKR